MDGRGITHTFHDYKAEGIDRARLEKWADRAGWELLLNRAGTTFKKLDEAKRLNLDRDKAIRLMLAQPSMIKRPVLEKDDELIVGFKPEIYDDAFAAR